VHVVDTNNRPIMCGGCGGQINATCGPFTVSHFGGKLYHPACVQTAMAKADEIAALKAERQRAQEACEKMGRRIAELEAEVKALRDHFDPHGVWGVCNGRLVMSG